MPPKTKERIVRASAEAFRRRGYTGTGLKQIVAEANAPFGSLYHFFPGGKEQLGVEVVRWSGAQYLELIAGVFDAAPDAATGIDDFFALAAEVLEETGYADACPLETLALEVANTSEPLREATATAFQSWLDAVAERFVAAGIPPVRAAELAVAAFSGMEGAFVLSRAMRTTAPLTVAGDLVSAAVRDALADGHEQ